jgi:ribonuclease E
VQVVDETAATPRPQSAQQGESDQRRKRRRRRRGRNRDDKPMGSETDVIDSANQEDGEANDLQADESGELSLRLDTGETEQERKKRRRGRRGGRRNRDDENGKPAMADASVDEQPDVNDVTEEAVSTPAEVPVEEVVKVAKPRGRKPKAKVETSEEPSPTVTVEVAEKIEDSAPVKVKKPRAPRKTATATENADAPIVSQKVEAPAEPVVVSASSSDSEPIDGKPRKGGWWQRKGFF